MTTAYYEGEKINCVAFKKNNLEQAEYDNCSFENCDFSNNKLNNSIFADCTFVDCNFSLAELSGTTFQQVLFKNCKLLGLQFQQCNPFGLSFTFENCNIDHASFYQLKLKKTSFKSCQLREVDFSESDLTGSSFPGCDLNQAVFDQTNLEQVDFRDAKNVMLSPNKNKLKKAKFSLTSLPGLLTEYGIKVES